MPGRGEWPATLSHRLAGSTLGIFGLGTIGELVARVGPAFGMRVLVWGREKSLELARARGYEAATSRGLESGVSSPSSTARPGPIGI